MEAKPKLIHGLPARSWKKKLPKLPAKDDEPEDDINVTAHKTKEIRNLCDLLADQFSDVGRSVSARQVLDALERFWPGDCRTELMKGRE